MNGRPLFNGQWTSYKARGHREAALEIRNILSRLEFGRNIASSDEQNSSRRFTSVLHWYFVITSPRTTIQKTTS